MVLESYGESIYTKLHDLAIAAGVADKDMSDESASKIFIQAIKDMKSRFNIGDTISEIKEEDILSLQGMPTKRLILSTLFRFLWMLRHLNSSTINL